MARCVATRRLPGKALDRLAAEHDVDIWPEPVPPPGEWLRERAAGAAGLLTLLTDRVDRDLIDALPDLRAISNYAVGTDNVDLEAATERGIPVGNTPDVLTETTADLAFGHAVARRAEGFGMTVRHTGRSGIGTPLELLLEESDFVSLHCPLTDDTRGLIGEAALRSMKSTAVLVNTARGPIVDSEALARALMDGSIGAAALDVTDPEPLPGDHPLLEAPNLTVVPHVGSATHATRGAMADLAVDNLLAALRGERMPHCANPQVYGE